MLEMILPRDSVHRTDVQYSVQGMNYHCCAHTHVSISLIMHMEFVVCFQWDTALRELIAFSVSSLANKKEY